MTGKLQGRVALISGTGGGQGREAALRFAAEGALIAGCDVNAETDQETAELVAKAGGRMTSMVCDLGDPDGAKAWVDKAVADYGRIDILYNNASASRFGLMPDLSVEDWRFTIRNELELVFFCTKYAWPHLAATGKGVILNIASVAGHHASKGAGLSAHAASKGAVISMTRQFALEGAKVGIRAVSISPGFIVTPGTRAFVENPATREVLVSGIPMGRPGEAEEIVGLALFLASDEASYITGSDFLVDGGMTA